jgi:hypothetical protein
VCLKRCLIQEHGRLLAESPFRVKSYPDGSENAASALPRSTDINRPALLVRFVPRADLRGAVEQVADSAFIADITQPAATKLKRRTSPSLKDH